MNIAFLILFGFMASANILKWAPSPEMKSQITGYKVYWRVVNPEPFYCDSHDCKEICPSKDKLSHSVDAGDVTEYNMNTDPAFRPGVMYEIKVSAYNQAGESAMSDKTFCTQMKKLKSPELDDETEEESDYEDEQESEKETKNGKNEVIFTGFGEFKRDSGGDALKSIDGGERDNQVATRKQVDRRGSTSPGRFHAVLGSRGTTSNKSDKSWVSEREDSGRRTGPVQPEILNASVGSGPGDMRRADRNKGIGNSDARISEIKQGVQANDSRCSKDSTKIHIRIMNAIFGCIVGAIIVLLFSWVVNLKN